MRYRVTTYDPGNSKMWVAFCTWSIREPSAYDQANVYGATPPEAVPEKLTASGATPDVTFAVATPRSGGGNTSTATEAQPRPPPASTIDTLVLYTPGRAYVWFMREALPEAGALPSPKFHTACHARMAWRTLRRKPIMAGAGARVTLVVAKAARTHWERA